MAYYVVVTSYAMLPVRGRGFCVAMGVVTGLAHLAVFTVVAVLRSTDHLVFQVNDNVKISQNDVTQALNRNAWQSLACSPPGIAVSSPSA